jgi:uncharacterized ferritin-like protein (DUF455 family)
MPLTKAGQKRRDTREDLQADAALAVKALAGEKLRQDPALANAIAQNADSIAEGVLRILRRHWSIRRKQP